LAAVKAVAIRELKNRLSAYLREVARGEIVLVTDRGRVVAELRRPSGEVVPSAVDQALERLHAEGALVPGLPQDKAAYRRTRVRMRGSSQSLLDADRAER
jgi:antitoxin (DNA-binding transcriptional repressor) of toxin-antitoxin stability system